MKRILLMLAAIVATMSLVKNAYAVEERHIGIFCNSREAAVWLARVVEMRGQERALQMMSIQQGRARATSLEPEQDSLWCGTLDVRSSEWRPAGEGVLFGGVRSQLFKIGNFLFKIDIPVFFVEGTDWWNFREEAEETANAVR